MGISLLTENSVVTTEGTHKKPKWTPQCKLGKSQHWIKLLRFAAPLPHITSLPHSLLIHPFLSLAFPLAIPSSYRKRTAMSWNGYHLWYPCSVPCQLYKYISAHSQNTSFLLFFFSLSLSLRGRTFSSLYLTLSVAHSCGILLKYTKRVWKQPVPKIFYKKYGNIEKPYFLRCFSYERNIFLQFFT